MLPTKWDDFYLGMAKYVATKSKDPSTKAGAVIVRPNRTVVSVGFNGFPQKMRDKPEWYADRAEKYSRIIHCEINALIHAATSIAGCTLYTFPFGCCDRCVVQMIQAGITRFVYPQPSEDALLRWAKELHTSRKYMLH